MVASTTITAMAHPPVEPARRSRRVARDRAGEAIAAAVHRAPPSAGGTVVVAIDGRSGAGKTALADELARRHGWPVVRLELVYPGWDGLAEGVRIVTEEVLEPLSRGESASHPVWDWSAGRWGRRRPVRPTPVLVLEGCGSLAPGPTDHVAVGVWVEAPEDVRKERALARDGDVFAPHWARWARQEEALLRHGHPAGRADLVVEGVVRA
jgi:cytidylate kinase